MNTPKYEKLTTNLELKNYFFGNYRASNKTIFQKGRFSLDNTIVLTIFTLEAIFVVLSDDYNFNKTQSYDSEIIHFLPFLGGIHNKNIKPYLFLRFFM